MGREPTHIPKLAYTLNSGMQTTECLRQTLPHIRFSALRHGQERKASGHFLEQLRKIISRIMFDTSLREDGAAGTFNQCFCQVKSKTRILLDRNFDSGDLSFDVK